MSFRRLGWIIAPRAILQNDSCDSIHRKRQLSQDDHVQTAGNQVHLPVERGINLKDPGRRFHSFEDYPLADFSNDFRDFRRNSLRKVHARYNER